MRTTPHPLSIGPFRAYFLARLSNTLAQIAMVVVIVLSGFVIGTLIALIGPAGGR